MAGRCESWRIDLIEFLLEDDTAGDPASGQLWSRTTTARISGAVADFGVMVCPNTVARLLHSMGYSLRVNHKKLAPACPDRNNQFLIIQQLRQQFRDSGLPIVSVDTKKREMVGNFKNPGKRWGRSPLPVNDHDFLSLASGIAIPYGVYDTLANRAASPSASPTTPPPSPSPPSPAGGPPTGDTATRGPANCSSWPTAAAATDAPGGCGRPNSSARLPTRSA